MKKVNQALKIILGDIEAVDKFMALCKIQGKSPALKLKETTLSLIWYNESLMNPALKKKSKIVFKTSVNKDLWEKFKETSKERNITISQLFCALVKNAPFYLEVLHLNQTRKQEPEKRIKIGIKIDQETFDILENFSRHYSKSRGQIGGQILDNCKFVI